MRSPSSACHLSIDDPFSLLDDLRIVAGSQILAHPDAVLRSFEIEDGIEAIKPPKNHLMKHITDPEAP
jgi:hypothetical protein